MTDLFKPLKISEHVYWVGAIDWDIRHFHGYLTSRGTTYNAFLVLGDKVALIDTVKAPFEQEMMSRISSIIDPGDIDYIVSNHSEMDHTGCLPSVLPVIRPEAIFASKMGAKTLERHFAGIGDSITVAGDGEKLDLGRLSLAFYETRMCHWPDSMVTYLHEDKVLFSQDAFGMHLAGGERFADEIDPSILYYEAAKYYANILLHLSEMVRKALDKIGGLGLEIDILAPDHGPVRRKPGDIRDILDAYSKWSSQTPCKKAVVLYDTMWQSTSRMARAVGEGLAGTGIEAKLLSMDTSHRSDAITEILEAGGLIVGSPTMNNQVIPSISDAMTYIRGLKPRNLVGAAFGSYGWSGEAPKHLHKILQEMGVETVSDPLCVNYVPTVDDLVKCRLLGEQVGKSIKKNIAS